MAKIYRIVLILGICAISVQAEYRCDTYCTDSKLGVGYSYDTHTSAPADITNHGAFLAGSWRRWDSQYGFSWEAKAGYAYTRATNTPQSPIAFTQSHIATSSGFLDMLLHFGKNLRTMQNPLFVEIVIGANVSLYQAQSKIPNNGLATIGLGISGIQRLSENLGLEYSLSYGYGVYGTYVYLRSQDLWHNTSTLKPNNHEIRASIGLQHNKKYRIYTRLSGKYQILDSASPTQNYVGNLVSYPHSTRFVATLEVGVSLP
ncbi:hypothetical protein [uncultured Helicobacter sp.]|uniref:hypothetical protein n=1 Tax=uncultured Helicobacter sp. TaxID=175537 RepID=UPI001C3B8B8F|nr:hypothetical protein [Candidatus Helicobacter avicola]